MPFSITKKRGVGIVSITGRFLGAPELTPFKAAIEELKDEGITNVVIDLSKTDMMDSSAIGLTISTLTTMRNAGGDAVIASLNQRIKNLFVMTRLLGSVFKDYESIDEAIDALSSKTEG
jgi:anti-sigma B factor antagonist